MPRRFRRGLCDSCYRHDYRRGLIDGTGRGTAHERIDARVVIDESSGCWKWTGDRSKDGYSRVSIHGRLVSVHRYQYERYVGPIPEGLQIDHLCRVRNCVNPQHLEPVTISENKRRSWAAIRSALEAVAS